MKIHKLKGKALPIAIAVVTLLFALGITSYFARGTLRSTILPHDAYKRHRSTIEKILDDNQTSTNQVIAPLGLKFNQMSSTNCMLDIAIRWHTAIYCLGEIDTMATPRLYLNGTDKIVKHIDQAMHKLGWQGGPANDGVELLDYYKSVKGIDCTIQIFNNSNTNYMATPSRLFCEHDYYYFGNPYGH